MFDVVGLAKSALDVVGGWIGLQSKKLALKNAEDVKAAEKAQNVVKQRDSAAQAIAKHDVTEIQKRLAE